MFLPVKHPEDLRFRLSRIGIDPSNDTEVVCGYGCLRLLEHIVRLRKWRLPFAAYKNEDVHRLLVGVFPEATKAFDRNLESPDYWKSFADAYDAAVKMPAETFIRNVCPNFVTDPNACVRILSLKMSETKGDFTPLTQCLHLIFTWRSKSESMEQAYAVYEDLALRLELAAVPWEDFAYLYKAVNCFSLSDVPPIRSLSNAAQASRIFTDASIPRYLQIDLFRAIYEARPHVKDCNIFQHIRKKPDSYPYMFDNMTGLEKRFNEAAELLRTVKPSEFLETLLTEARMTKTSMTDVLSLDSLTPRHRKRRNDIPDAATECSYVYSQFTNYLTVVGAKKVLIANPAIPFIRKWCKDKALADVETFFMTEWDSSAVILKSEFSKKYPQCHFVSITDFHMPGEYDACLLFYRNYIDNQRHMEFADMLIDLFYGKAFFWLLPDEKAKQIINGIYVWKKSKAGEKIDAMDILPTEVFTSEPKKKVFLRFVPDKADGPIALTGYLCKKDPALKMVLYPIGKDIKTTYQTLSGEDTIRAVYRNGGIIAARPERQRKLPNSYQFSPELTVWYTLNPPKDDAHLTPKVKVYICQYPTQNQKRNLLKRGREIPDAHIWKTNYLEGDIPSWIGYTAIFAPAVYQAAVTMIREQYKQNAPISLRTFWYMCSPTGISPKDVRGKEINRFIRGPAVEKLKVGRSLKEDYTAAVDLFMENSVVSSDELRDEVLLYIWDFLCDLLDKAVEKGYYKVNPLEDLISRVRSRHSEFQELRDALTKKTFTQDEELQLLAAIQEDDSPLALGAMIRLYTGMSPTQVCALRYRDFIVIPHTEGYQFLVYQKVTKAGAAPSPLKRPEEYRRIPVVPILAERLCRHIQSLEEDLGTKVRETDYFIVSEDLLGGIIPETPKPYAPSTLQKYCKELVKSMGIEHVTLTIPDEKDGSKESDFTNYQSDIFRTNLRYRLKNTCGFTNSECDYVLGVQMKNTFAKHYCDFTNPFAQLVMLAKLSWWCACHQPGEKTLGIKLLSLRNNHLCVSPVGGECASAALTLLVAPETEGVSADMMITVDSPHGWSGSINLIEEDREHDR